MVGIESRHAKGASQRWAKLNCILLGLKPGDLQQQA
jgi:hypothetical protein